MNILLENKHYYPSIGGVEVVVKQLSDRFVKAGHKVTVITFGENGRCDEMIDGVRVVRFPYEARFEGGISMDAWKFLSQMNRKELFDVASIQNFPIPLSMEASVFCRVNHIPFLFTPHYHGKGLADLRNGILKLYRPIGQRAFSWCRGIIVNSHFEKDLLIKDFPRFADKMTVVPPGAKNRSFFDVKREAGAILFVGRIVDYKGIDHVIDAMKVLKDRGLECRLRVIGEGPKKTELSSKADLLGISDRVTWLGAVDEETLNKEYSRASLLVLLSDKEAYGLVVAEALNCGTPCLVSTTQALAEYTVEPGCYGIDPPYELNELTDTIASILYPKEPIKVGPLSDHISTWDRTANRYMELFEKIRAEKT